MMARTLLRPALLIATLCVAPPLSAQVPVPPAAPAPAPAGPTRAEIDAAGPKVGQRALDFTLADQNGQRRSLQASLGPNGALLVFFRSADW